MKRRTPVLTERDRASVGPRDATRKLVVRRETRTLIEPAGMDPRSPERLASLIKLASHSGQNVRNSACYLLDKITKLHAAGTWPTAVPDEPRTWERFCTEVLGYPAAYVEKMREAVAMLDGDPPAGAPPCARADETPEEP